MGETEALRETCRQGENMWTLQDSFGWVRTQICLLLTVQQATVLDPLNHSFHIFLMMHVKNIVMVRWGKKPQGQYDRVTWSELYDIKSHLYILQKFRQGLLVPAVGSCTLFLFSSTLLFFFTHHMCHIYHVWSSLTLFCRWHKYPTLVLLKHFVCVVKTMLVPQQDWTVKC